MHTKSFFSSSSVFKAICHRSYRKARLILFQVCIFKICGCNYIYIYFFKKVRKLVNLVQPTAADPVKVQPNPMRCDWMIVYPDAISHNTANIVLRHILVKESFKLKCLKGKIKPIYLY